MMRVSDLSPNPRNPRKVTDKKLDMLKRALKEHGDLGGIVFNRRTQRLAGGHQRVKVLPPHAEIEIVKSFSKPTDAGTVAIGFVWIEGEPYIYREVDVDETREKAANIAANKGAGEWDMQMLSEWLLELDAMNFDMDLTMFDADELEDLMAPVNKVEGLCDEDEIPEHVEPKTKPGDIYRLGRHRLMCGDSTSIDNLEQLAPSILFDAVITDPPYNVGKGYAGEDLDATEFDSFHRGWLSCATAKAKDDAAFYVYFGVKWLWPMADVTRQYLNNPRLLVWYRPDGHGAGGGDFFYNFDPIFYGSKTGKFATRKYEGEFNRDVWIVNKAKESDGGFEHPTVKPILVIEGAVLTSTDEGNNVLDLFGGSGSTLIACEKNRRNAHLMELDPHYCDVIVARWEAYTGQKAELLSDAVATV